MSLVKQRASLLAVIALSALALVLSTGAMLEGGGKARPVARPKSPDDMRRVLLLNGDRDRDFVSFDHEAHKERLKESHHQLSKVERKGNCKTIRG